MSKSELTDHERAIVLISEGNISKIKEKENDDFYHVKGSKDEYLVILPKFCTCEQFILRCINTPGKICYHILAVQMAGEIKQVSDENWIKLLLKDHL